MIITEEYDKIVEEFSNLKHISSQSENIYSNITYSITALVFQYNKLIEVIDVPALDNWKTFTNRYYTKIFEPLVHIKNEELNNRPETLASTNKDPY